MKRRANEIFEIDKEIDKLITEPVICGLSDRASDYRSIPMTWVQFPSDLFFLLNTCLTNWRGFAPYFSVMG